MLDISSRHKKGNAAVPYLPRLSTFFRKTAQLFRSACLGGEGEITSSDECR